MRRRHRQTLQNELLAQVVAVDRHDGDRAAIAARAGHADRGDTALEDTRGGILSKLAAWIAGTVLRAHLLALEGVGPRQAEIDRNRVAVDRPPLAGDRRTVVALGCPCPAGGERGDAEEQRAPHA